jgi:hypothetical protein
VSIFHPGEDVEIDFEGADEWWPAEVLRCESSGYVICKTHIDPTHDFGSSSPRISPEQTVAVRTGRVRHVNQPHGVS